MDRARLGGWVVGCMFAVAAADSPPAATGVAEPPEGMVLVPAGEFIMGSSRDDNWSEDDERPQRVVHVGAFYIDQVEVTNLQYRRFLEETGWPISREWRDLIGAEDTEFLPVTGVSWQDATAYARWAGKRLPTEAEWEKAARGTDGRRFPWGDSFSSDHANNDRGLLAVGSKQSGASPYGVHDMAGNVAEWTATAYAPYPRVEAILPGEFGGGGGASPVPGEVGVDEEDAVPVRRLRRIDADDPRLRFLTPEELQDDRPRVYRGGSANSYARFLRCANRESDSPRARWANIGFRCAADVAGAAKP